MNLMSGGIFIFGLITFALVIFRDVGLTVIFNLDAFLIVVGGTTIALFVGFHPRRIHETVYHIVNTFTKERNKEDAISDILSLSRLFRRINIKGIENWMKNIDDHFLNLGVSLLIGDYKDREIKAIMQREMVLRITEHNFSQNVLRTVARLTPAFGLAGTVISLVKMFNNFNSVDALAPHLAVALMSTLYGVIIANLFMLPLIAKLKEKAIVSESIMLITIEGILSVKNMEHPIIIEEKLRGYQCVETTYSPVINNAGIVPNEAGTI